MSNSFGVVILARFSSSRLPGKALMMLEGRAVLGHILDRLNTVISKERIVLATSVLPSDDPIESFAKSEGIQCYRGSLEKVGERFYEAAAQLDVDYACRLNGDNVFLDPQLILSFKEIASSGKYSFLSNVHGRTFPKGMSVEVVKTDFYKEQLPRISADPYCNEHVMVCLYEDPPPGNYYYAINTELPEASAIQLALDTPEDWERSTWMMKRIPGNCFDLKTTFEYYTEYEQSIAG